MECLRLSAARIAASQQSRPTGKPARQIYGFSRHLQADPQRAAVREADAIHGVQICASGHDATTALKRFSCLMRHLG
jgi:hypothetical protein